MQGPRKSIYICVVLQNLFSAGKEIISSFRSSHYLVLLRNPLDQTTVYMLAQRINPAKRKTTYRDAFPSIDKI